jgi:transcriptional antiterminator NusG
VKTREEEKYIRLFRALHPEIDVPIHFPQRVLDIRRRGKISHRRSAVFPGYIFLELENEDDIFGCHWAFRRTSGFFRFLPSSRNIRPLADRDLGPVLHFIKTVGPVAGKSLVSFDQDNRITVIQGPLSGLEGKIVKVDKRKKRAKIRLDLYDDSFTVDLSFETITGIEGSSR